MGSLARKMLRAAKKKPAPVMAHQKPPSHSFPGIFCDCYGTLYGYDFEKDDLLVEYLNLKRATGVGVYLVSTVPMQVYQKIENIGLADAIVDTLNDKRRFPDAEFEVLIDDDPTNRAKKIWHPKDKQFRAEMQAFVENNRTALEPSPQP